MIHLYDLLIRFTYTTHITHIELKSIKGFLFFLHYYQTLAFYTTLHYSIPPSSFIIQNVVQPPIL